MRKLLITLLLTIGVFSFSFAEHEQHETNTYDFYWNQMPTVCAWKGELNRWIEDNNFQPVSVGFGRRDGRQEGEIVYAVTIYINDNYEMAAVVETPGGEDACVVFRTFDMQLNPNLKPGRSL